MTGKRQVFLGLSVVGLVLTWFHNIRFMLGHDGGFGLVAFLQGGMANAASASLTMDIAVAAVTGLVWMTWESRRLGMKHLWFYYVTTVCVAFAFAFPFFLYQREKYLDSADKE